MDTGVLLGKIDLPEGILVILDPGLARKILDEGEPIRFAERMAPSHPSDSGWSFSSGTEDAEYMADAKNLAMVRLATLSERHPEIGEILSAPVGTLFRREGDRLVVDE